MSVRFSVSFTDERHYSVEYTIKVCETYHTRQIKDAGTQWGSMAVTLPAVVLVGNYTFGPTNVSYLHVVNRQRHLPPDDIF